MIIEFFGAPGAGKTTVARALAARLEKRGLSSELRLSWRPKERLLSLQPSQRKMPSSAAARRVIRALTETVAIAAHPLANKKDLETAFDLLALLPAAGPLSLVKKGQYLLRLSHLFREQCPSSQFRLFDQAFVQSVCSLAIERGETDDGQIGRALSRAPKSDIVIRLVAPVDLLEDRLTDRLRVQGTLERRLETDPARSLGSLSLFDRVHDLLLKQGQSVLQVSSFDEVSLEASLSTIERELIEKQKVLEERNGSWL